MRALKALALLLALCFTGCNTQPRASLRLPDPPYRGVTFVQSGSAVLCDGNFSGCSQQIFTIQLPNVGDSDTVKIAVKWFSAYFIKNPNGPGQIMVVPPVPTVTDSVNSSYSLVQTVVNYGDPAQMGYIFSTPSVKSGGNSVTVTLTLPFSTSNYTAVVALEYSGGSIVDGQSSLGVSGPAPANSGPLTITSDQDVVLSLYFGNLANTTACPTCNLRFSGANFIVQDSFPSAAGIYTAQFVSSPVYGSYAVIAVGFQ